MSKTISINFLCGLGHVRSSIAIGAIGIAFAGAAICLSGCAIVFLGL